jgi:hypothetical protein
MDNRGGETVPRVWSCQSVGESNEEKSCYEEKSTSIASPCLFLYFCVFLCDLSKLSERSYEVDVMIDEIIDLVKVVLPL